MNGLQFSIFISAFVTVIVLLEEAGKIKFIFAWYDFWVGFFYDKKKHWLYVFPIPCFGFIIKFRK